MDAQQIIILLTGLASMAGGYLIRYFQAKGVHTAEVRATDTVACAAATSADKASDFAGWAVKAAEQLYKANHIQKEQRKAEAQDLVVSALKATGYKVTPELHPVINGAVESAVMLLPRTHDAQGNIAKPSILDKQVGL